MGEFVCRVADADGRVFSHVEAAGSVAEARQKLADRGLFVFSVNPRSSLISGLFQKASTREVRGSDFLILNQQFNTLIKAGLPILRALDLLAERAASARLRPVVGQIRDRVREGKSLSEAVNEAGVFSKVYSKPILATLVYPTLLVIVATGVVTYLVTGVIPKFALLYKDMNVPLPTPTRVLIALTVDYRYWFLAAFAAILLTILGIWV